MEKNEKNQKKKKLCTKKIEVKEITFPGEKFHRYNAKSAGDKRNVNSCCLRGKIESGLLFTCYFFFYFYRIEEIYLFIL